LQRQKRLHHKTVLKLWDHYDENHDGNLSAKEHKHLMRDYFDGSYSVTAEVMSDLMEVNIRETMAVLKAQGAPHDAAEETLRVKVPIIKREVPKIVKNILVRWDNEENYERILDEMDSDGNGVVEKKEFVDKFILAINHVLDPDVLADEITKKVRKLLARADGKRSKKHSENH
jgi:hypothetical protein